MVGVAVGVGVGVVVAVVVAVVVGVGVAVGGHIMHPNDHYRIVRGQPRRQVSLRGLRATAKRRRPLDAVGWFLTAVSVMVLVMLVMVAWLHITWIDF